MLLHNVIRFLPACSHVKIKKDTHHSKREDGRMERKGKEDQVEVDGYNYFLDDIVVWCRRFSQIFPLWMRYEVPPRPEYREFKLAGNVCIYSRYLESVHLVTSENNSVNS
jgi:hypothetical protein